MESVNRKIPTEAVLSHIKIKYKILCIQHFILRYRSQWSIYLGVTSVMQVLQFVQTSTSFVALKEI
jgi:hypothetical protein